MKIITHYIIILPHKKESTIYVEDYILMDSQGESILLFDDFNQARLFKEQYLKNNPLYIISEIKKTHQT